MKHFIVSFLALTIFVAAGCSIVLAKESTPPGALKKEVALANLEDRKEAQASKAAIRREAQEERKTEHKEEMASKSAALKARLALFKDQKKAAIAERINTTLLKINENRTDTMRKHLDKMTELLGKLEERVASKSAQGKDTTQADAAIASASAAIASASAAIDAQVLKDYTITVSSESAIHTDAKEARDSVHTDLQLLRRILVDTKQLVANAIRIAATTLGGIGEGPKEATQGGTQ